MIQRLDEADVTRIGTFVVESAEVPLDEEPFGPAFLAALRRLVPCDFVSYQENDWIRCRLLAFTEDPIYDGPEPEGHLADVGSDDPSRRYLDGIAAVRANRLSDALRPHELRRSRFYAEWFVALGLAYELRIGLDSPRRHAKLFRFDRGPGRDFTERDRAVLDAVVPLLTARYSGWSAARCSRPLELDGAATLTVREYEVLELVSEGLTNGEIAQRLWISPGTVRRHLENIYAKLGVHTRTAAVNAAPR